MYLLFVYDNDNFLWCLWPWVVVKAENTDRRFDGVQFCDHSIDVIRWELRFEDEMRSSVWQITDSHKTADSLEEFFNIYLVDPWRLL